MKRGESGLSFLVGVDKPSRLSSHDVINRCRGIFGERRIGHVGTLDPLATGVLLVCVGPATRLNPYLVEHDKRYRVRIALGAKTNTDDAFGTIVARAPIPHEACEEAWARQVLQRFVGKQRQLPPDFSACKVGGVRAYDAARKGNLIELSYRDIEVFDMMLLGIEEASAEGLVMWDVEMHVSKGTYVRSLVRDIGHAIGCFAHVYALCRLSVGSLFLQDCVSLDALSELRTRAAIDPVRLLGLRFAYVSDSARASVENGCQIPRASLNLYTMRQHTPETGFCSCLPNTCESAASPYEGELISLVLDNQLKALYAFDAKRDAYGARCVFQVGVSRGTDI